MPFIDKFPTYIGLKPSRQGKYVNMEKEQIEDWTHTALRSEDPNPLFISFEALGTNPELNYERWIKEMTSDIGGGDFV